jgi:20S proteasome subunit alpha 6
MSLEAQHNTQFYGDRPYGVGMLLGGRDATGVHLIECSPTGNYFEYYGMAIGARSQAARTFLEKYLDLYSTRSLLTPASLL